MTIEHFSYQKMNSGGPASLDKETIKENMEKHEQLEYSVMLENLKTLDDWCKKHGKTEFFAFFQDSILGAYYRFVHAKRQTWDDEGSDNSGESECGKKQVPINTTAIISSAGAVVLTVITLLLGAEILDKTAVISAICLYGFLAIDLSVIDAIAKRDEKRAQAAREAQERAKKEEEAQKKKRNYYETWSRHSLCLNRLSIALNKFAVSNRLAADFNELQKDTFEILEQNLDQFAMNVSSKGLAVRAKKDD